MLLFAMACCGLLHTQAAAAKQVDRQVMTHDGLTLEVSAPRADIIRIRMGHPNLPEDASWALRPEVHGQTTPMTVTHDAKAFELRTASAIVTVDAETLQVSICDAAGKSILLDADEGTQITGDGFALHKQIAKGSHYFGLGDKTGPLDRLGNAFTLWNTDSFGFGASTDPLYKSVPFFLSVNETGQSFGFLLDNTWRSDFDFGKRDPAKLVVGARAGPIDYYVLVGPQPKAVLDQYAWLTGTAPLSPLWALGFQQSHYSYMTQTAAQAIADRLRADHVPADALYLDIDYQDRNRPFTVNRAAFPDLPQLVTNLKAEHLRLVLITDLHIAQAADQNYLPYDTGKAEDVFVKNPDGSDYVGKVWPGAAVFPDFSRARVRQWWGDLYAGFVSIGVAGFWNDMNEPAIFDVASKTMPLDVQHRIDEPGFATRTASHAELHNVYGMLNSRATYEGLLKLVPNRRPFVLTRASFAGGQRYAATWTGDNSSTWEHLHLSIPMLVNLGLSGFAYAGDDIGGFTGMRPSPELLTRWIEIGAFNPLFRLHSDKIKTDQELWADGPEQEAIRRRYIEERYRLLPYLYSVAEENSRDGLPILRPVFLEYPKVLGEGAHFGGSEDQFMLGEDLLIAPPTNWQSIEAYAIRLPGSGWYDYWTGQKLTGDEIVENPRLAHLPVFVRPGAIIARQALVESTMVTPQGPLQVDVYPGPSCRGDLYLDDGVSFAYQRGEYLRQELRCEVGSGNGRMNFLFERRQGRYRPWWTRLQVVVHDWVTSGATVRLNGRPVPAQFDASARTLSFTLPDQARSSTVDIAPPAP
jgi:alpha-glucosidase